jgi:hypothetical protein
MHEIWEALESTANVRGEKRVITSKNELELHRRYLLKFLDELDADLSVAEVREALEAYE